jgi:hypothetical protein
MKKTLPQPLIIDIARPDALKRKGLIVLDVAEEPAAMELAQKIAAATGRSVTVRDADMNEIKNIPAVTKQ